MILIGTRRKSKGVQLYLDSLGKAGRMSNLPIFRRFGRRNTGQDFSRRFSEKRVERMKIRSLYEIHQLRFC